MATWTPTPDDIRSLLPSWANAIQDDLAGAVAVRATADVGADVGAFDPTRPINPRAAASDRITLGDLARNAAALRAAQQWASGYMPERAGATAGIVQQLQDRYTEAVERLRTNVGMHGRIGHGEPVTGSVRMTLPTVGRGPSDVARG
ncbi:hypothetical protein [Euzebya rosea]|uniref:hypothetical protein n=1 Tax=Euzebya rosea TaxID=2052804 RepID=UPI000D3EC708|nr:hypothetical protein [Euzebya rosea]